MAVIFQITMGLLLAASLVSLFPGCGPAATHADPTPATEQFDEELSRAADEISAAWRQWGAIYSAAHPDALGKVDLGPPPVNLGKVMNLSWDGPIEPLLGQVARQCGYTFRAFGTAPGTPILVNLQGRFSAFEALEEAGYQAGPRVQVIIREHERMVVLGYSLTDGLRDRLPVETHAVNEGREEP